MKNACIGMVHFPEDVIRWEKRRGFQPPWYKVAVVRCGRCGTEHRLREPNGRFGIVCEVSTEIQ